jgi:long-chain acyl-CoA synthetase
VGTFDSLGRLTIIDRKKNMFKLAQGEYIAPERVENILSKSALISQVFVYGHSLETCTLAIIVPLNPAAQDLNTLLIKAVESFGKHGSKELSSLELPRAIYVESVPFSVENGLLTSTMKVKRQAVEQKYAQVFKNMYASVKEQQLGHNDASSTTVYSGLVA